MGKACVFDVRKNSVFACILDEQGKKNLEKRYETPTPDFDGFVRCIEYLYGRFLHRIFR